MTPGGNLNTRILIIDDDMVIQQSLTETLQSLGYEIEVAGKAVDGFGKAYRTKPDLIILDVMLPGMDGWQICQRFRAMTDIPILFLTALGSEDDIVKGLTLGGDDYLVKPVTMSVLAARVKALLRRANGSQNAGSAPSSVVEYQGLLIDLDKYEVRLNNRRLSLSKTEFNLLACLMTHRGRVLSHDFLLGQVWGPEYLGELSHLRLYIRYLRQKLEADPAKPQFIQTVRGVGYRFGEK